MSKTLAPSPKVTHRDSKGRKFMSIVAAAYDKAGLSEDEAQRINDTPGLAALIAGFIAKNRFIDRFEYEEVESTCGYLSGYRRPKSVAEQIKIIHEMFPDVEWQYFRPDEEQIVIPPEAEGLFAIPKWQIFASTYSEALQIVLDKLSEARGGWFHNSFIGELGPDRLQQTEKTGAAFEALAAAQGGYDILLVPAQFGIRHRGRSVHRAREIIADTPGEFGLGAFAIAIMLLTHPDRLQSHGDLCINGAGDQYDDRDADERFTEAPSFGYEDDSIEFGMVWFEYAVPNDGSASGFLPPQQ